MSLGKTRYLAISDTTCRKHYESLGDGWRERSYRMTASSFGHRWWHAQANGSHTFVHLYHLAWLIFMWSYLQPVFICPFVAFSPVNRSPCEFEVCFVVCPLKWPTSVRGISWMGAFFEWCITWCGIVRIMRDWIRLARNYVKALLWSVLYNHFQSMACCP